MFKADFYSDDYWVGSIYENGQPWNVPLTILTQTVRETYEEVVTDYLSTIKSKLSCRNDKWPWLWMDSRHTDYSYFYLSEHNRVYMSMFGDELIDPIKIVQGEDIISSRVNINYPEPKKVITAVFQEVIKRRTTNGFEFTKTI